MGVMETDDRSTVETSLAENRNFQACTTVEKEKCEEELERKLETKCTTVDAERCQQAGQENFHSAQFYFHLAYFHSAYYVTVKVPFALSHLSVHTFPGGGGTVQGS